MIARFSLLDQEEHLLLEIHALARRRARKVLEPDVADDVAQDVVLECLVKMRDGAWCRPVSLAGLVRQMVLRRTVDVYRRDRRRAERSAVHLSQSKASPPSWMQPDLALEELEYTALRASVLHVLPEGCRRVFAMVREEGLAYGAVATLLGLSRATVCAHVVHAQSKLRSQLIESGIAAPLPNAWRQRRTTTRRKVEVAR